MVTFEEKSQIRKKKQTERTLPMEVEGESMEFSISEDPSKVGPPEPPKPPTEPPKEGGKEPTVLEKLSKRIQEREALSKQQEVMSRSFLKNFLLEQAVDIDEPAKRRILKEGAENPEATQRLVDRMNTEKGASGQSKADLEDASTRVLGKGVKTMSKKQQAFLGEMIALKRGIEVGEKMEKIGEEYKHEGDVSTKEARELLDLIEAKDPEALSRFGITDYDKGRIDKSVDEYYNVMQEQLQKKLKEGLINEALYKKLSEEQPFYSPGVVMKYLDKVDRDGSLSGIKPLAGGSEAPRIVDPMTLMGHVISRTNALVLRNRKVKEASRFADAVPNDLIKNAKYSDKFTEKLEAKEEGDTFIEPEFAKTPHGMEAIDYMENGQRKRVWLDSEIAEPFKPETGVSKLEKGLTYAGWLSLTPVLKMAATGMNPEFAVKNLTIDALHAWMTTDIYSQWMPKALNQMRSDYAKVAKDAWTKTGRYKEYAEEGGLMDFLTTQGKIPTRYGKKTKLSSSVKGVGDAMAKIGEFSEVWTRLALRERHIDNAIKKMGREPTPEEIVEIKRDATAAARNYLDFSQGGSTAKALDKFIPYLNAGVQVTRGSLRAAGKNPKLFATKMGQIVSMVGAITAWNMGHSPFGDEDEKRERRNAYLNDINPGVKARNFVIVTNMTYTDKAGNQRRVYYKIPKDALQASISALAEDIYVKSTHDEDVKLLDDKMFKAMQAELRNITDLNNPKKKGKESFILALRQKGGLSLGN
jgi:hypothetical protein